MTIVLLSMCLSFTSFTSLFAQTTAEITQQEANEIAIEAYV